MSIVTVGVDQAKNVFAVPGVDATGKPVLLRPSPMRVCCWCRPPTKTRCTRLFWLAGQGGDGIQTAPAMGELTAGLVQQLPVPAALAVVGVRAEDVSPLRPQFGGNALRAYKENWPLALI